MKNVEENSLFCEMNVQEMKNVDGGFVFVIPVLALYLAGASLAGCAVTGAAYMGYQMNK